MKLFSIPLLSILISTTVFANDGAYFASGNQLIPISETKVSVKKEILTIRKVKNELIEVIVYYEFFNPEDEKTITVGFEAFSPYGDVDGHPANGRHPYMYNFTVLNNDKILPYKVAYVQDTAYRKDKSIQSKSLKEITEGIQAENYVSFDYVYYFDATFKKGLNIIKHTYNYKLSNSIAYNYDFKYILTAANRWANKQIDDFTLIVDMGEFEAFNISASFFKDEKNWIINGEGKTKYFPLDSTLEKERAAILFMVKKGNLIFQQKNFRPTGELFIYSFQQYIASQVHEFSLPFSYYQEDRIEDPKNDFEKKVLRNLPFARRGYVFKSQDLQDYYSKIEWYMPDPNYIPTLEGLTDTEKAWVGKFK
ncbi:MAG: YARHG domain-containing protein [Flavobacteriales bacterium]